MKFTMVNMTKALQQLNVVKFYENCKNLQEQFIHNCNKSIFTQYVRVVCSVHGFTIDTITLVEKYNLTHRDFPILLLTPTQKIIGEKLHNAILKKDPKIPKKSKVYPPLELEVSFPNEWGMDNLSHVKIMYNPPILSTLKFVTPSTNTQHIQKTNTKKRKGVLLPQLPFEQPEKKSKSDEKDEAKT